MKKIILSIISALTSILFLTPTVAAITPDYVAFQEIIATSAGCKAGSGDYTVSPGDTVQYAVKLELPETAALISIKPDISLDFMSAGSLVVTDADGNTTFEQNLGYTTTDGYFYDLSDMPSAGTGIFTYVVSVSGSPSTGIGGMNCGIEVSDADGNVLTASESPSVYTLDTIIHTVDIRLPLDKDATKNQNIAAYAGQGVEGAEFILYYDQELRCPVSFTEAFRTYTVCPDGTDNSTTTVVEDISGRLVLKGLRSGTYYLVEAEPAIDYYKATSSPIAVTLDLTRDAKGNLKITVNESEEEEKEDSVVLLSSGGNGTTVLLDYRDSGKGFLSMFRGQDNILLLSICGLGTLIVAGVIVSICEKKKPTMPATE